MPTLWTETVEDHRREVRRAILDAAWDLVAEHGLTSVTMSQVAERAGIGRATLYKYFPDIATILQAWHERHVADHLEHLAEVRDLHHDPGERLTAVLHAYARIAQQRGHGSSDVVALLHRDEHVDKAQLHLQILIRDLLADAAASGAVRNDVTPDELAIYCVGALGAASSLPSEAAVQRLVEMTLAGVLPSG